MLKKNDIVTLSVDGITSEGSGVGRFEGVAVFVPGAADGDLIRARIVKVLSSYCFGIIEEILAPSPFRTEDGCVAYRQCGGCSLRHIVYEHEVEVKNGWVVENMRRIGGLTPEILPPLPSPQSSRYRNKAVYPVRMENGELRIGFFAKRSHRVIDCTACALHPPEFETLLGAVRAYLLRFSVPVYNEERHAGLVRSVFLRHGEATGEIMVCLIVNGSAIPEEKAFCEMIRAASPKVVSIILNSNTEKTNVLTGRRCRTLWGEGGITDRIGALQFKISPLSFFQVNRAGAERLYDAAAGFAQLTGRETVLDLYCGTGTIGLFLAACAKEVIGVEIVAPAVENARENAKINGIQNARFLCADAAQAAAQLRDEGIHPDVVVVDPPRKGLDPALIETIAGMAPDRVVMVSCNSATAARDAKQFDALGYHCEKLQAVDLFPRTAHVETVVLLSKLNTKQHIEVELNLDELDLTSAESKATYDEIKAYVLEKHGLKVSSLYISQVKRTCGLDVGQNYNLSKKEDAKVPQCPLEKEAAIMDALKHFQMI